MDSRTWIDYALFHLTPTRTRCDLVIFANGQSEKLASGLIQPFLLHLKCAKEQFERGGYSFTLTPPVPATWFSKGTLQRFVRFVSSPEVLERFVTIEKEIEQIEESIRSNELACEEVDANGKEASADEIHKKTISASELNGEIEETNNAAQEEHSKVHLHRVLENRKAVLHKEQAMVYARALVSGFQTNHLDALLSFADVFGASRLRKACYNFIELCKKKNKDRLWMAEVAAMQASSQSHLSYSGTSGIVLADEENVSGQFPIEASQGVHLPASDQVDRNGKPQSPSPWANNYPQYFPNYYSLIHPQSMPPYQGYPFPGMQAGNPYYPGNMFGESGRDHKSKNSVRKKENLSREKRLDTAEQGVVSDSSSESASEESMEGGKKHSSKKKTQKKGNGRNFSKKVVIRNISYINSKNDGSSESSSDDEELFDEDYIKQQIEDAVGSFNRHQRHKKQLQTKHASVVNGSNELNLGNQGSKNSEGDQMSESWGAFQNILMRDQDTNTNTVSRVEVEKDTFAVNNYEGSTLSRQQAASSDSFVVNRDNRGNEDRMQTGNFDAGDSFRPYLKNSNISDEMMMLSRGNEEQGNFIRTTQSDFASRSAIVKSKSEEDWYVNTHKNGSSYHNHGSDQKVLEGEYTSSVNSNVWIDKSKNDMVDDSFIVQARGNQYDSELKTDLSTVLDIAEVTHQQNDGSDKPQEKRQTFGTFEPDDLYMVLDRSSSHEPVSASWTPEIDYENIVKVSETDKNQSSGEPNAEDDQLAKGKVNSAPRSKTVGGPFGKSKSEILSRSRKPSPGNKTLLRKSKQDLEEERRHRMEELLIQRQKRIAERKANSVTITSTKLNKEAVESKRSIKIEKSPVKSAIQEKKLIMRPSTIDRLATARISKQMSEAQSKKASPKAVGEPKKSIGNGTKKLAPSKEKRIDKKNSDSNPKGIGILTSKSDISEKMDIAEPTSLPQVEVISAPAPTLAIDCQTKGKNPEDLETYNSDISEKKESLVLPVKVTSFPAPTLDEVEEVKELQTLVLIGENKDKMISQVETLMDNNSNVNSLPNNIVATDEKTISESSQLKAIDQGIAKQLSTEKATDALAENYYSGMPAKDPDSLGPNTKQAKAPSVTFAATTKISEIQVFTPPSSIRLSPDHIHYRKKWDNNDYSNSNSAKVAKGFKKLLMFGRKSRPISYA
ncbi:unnamed protein product [Rhodiola kirilowii]